MKTLSGRWGLVDLARYIEREDICNVIVMLGAGVSVAAGIPDFRGPHGIYARIREHGTTFSTSSRTVHLENPENLFDTTLFKNDPSVFYAVAKEINLWPRPQLKPTAVHHFVSILQERGKLLRCYTQNIDTLERRAGLSSDKLVEAHGSFSSAHCVDCGKVCDMSLLLPLALKGDVPHCEHCKTGVPKPDIVFFGENLPLRFEDCLIHDRELADLCLIIGTSLTVHPFAGMPSRLPYHVPRVLINDKRVGGDEFVFLGEEDNRSALQPSSTDSEDIHRDFFIRGDAQTTVTKLAQQLMWEQNLKQRLIPPAAAEATQERQQPLTEAGSSSDGTTNTTTDAPPPGICPICRKPNKGCALENAKLTGKPQPPCWCTRVTFSPELIAKVPANAVNKACICEECVKNW